MFIKGRYLILGLILTMVVSSGATVVALNMTGAGSIVAPGANNPQFSKLMETYETISQNYFEEVPPDKMLNGAIDGMVKALDDPYSTYMDPTQAQSFHENISSSFEGIGAQISEEEGKIVIESPIKGSPAEKAGLRPKDRILSVDGKDLQGMKSSEAVTHIRGKKGTKAELVIERPGEAGTFNVTVVRDTIPQETVYSEMRSDGIGKIRISQFSEPTGDDFEKALNELQEKGMKGLLLDLRQNPGGLLSVAVDIGNRLIPDQKLILQVEYRDGKKEVYRSKHGKSEFPIVVLVDEGSASAAEILAGALKESGDYPLVGTKSFGKGTVQTTAEFKDGSNIKYTTAKWLTPDGNWVHKKGLEPDHAVEMPAYATLPYLDPEKELKQDSFSNDVKTAQQYLEALGYHPGRTDGFFDAKTKEAVMAFQRVQNIEANGIVKGKTTTTMMELLRQKIEKNDTQLEKAEQVLRKILP